MGAGERLVLAREGGGVAVVSREDDQCRLASGCVWGNVENGVVLQIIRCTGTN